MIKFSVITTVYNQENYIKDCIESVINQTYSNLEFIIVDDGSTDNSYNICKEYAEKDDRIKLIRKENGGVSSARNVGIADISGDYVLFLDGDDLYCLELLENCYNELQKERFDIISFGIICCDENNNTIHVEKGLCFQDFKYNYNSYFNFFIKTLKNGDIVANKCINAKIIKNNNLLFCEKIRYGEDKLMFLEILAFVNSVSSIDYLGYNYRKCSTSFTHNVKNKEQIFSLYLISKNYYIFLQQQNISILLNNFAEIFWYVFDFQMIFGHMDLYWKIKKEELEVLKIEDDFFNLKKFYKDYKKKNKNHYKKLEDKYIAYRDDALKKYLISQNKFALNFRLFNLKVIMLFIKIKRKTKKIFKKN